MTVLRKVHKLGPLGKYIFTVHCCPRALDLRLPFCNDSFTGQYVQYFDSNHEGREHQDSCLGAVSAYPWSSFIKLYISAHRSTVLVLSIAQGCDA